MAPAMRHRGSARFVGGAKYRDGKQAIALGIKACQATDWDDYAILDTLAAAMPRPAISTRPFAGRKRPWAWRLR